MNDERLDRLRVLCKLRGYGQIEHYPSLINSWGFWDGNKMHFFSRFEALEICVSEHASHG